MHFSPSHINWLVQQSSTTKSTDGLAIQIWDLFHETDERILSEWAKHFRNHYCLDSEIDALRSGTGYSRTEYLNAIKFPDAKSRLGPSIRAGDFGEILVADFLEFILNYWVPRTRYDRKTVKDESTKGSDVIGFHVVQIGKTSEDDRLGIFETKTQLSGSKSKSKLQDAVNDSAKDILRKAESLNAIKQRIIDDKPVNEERIKIVERFQNEVDYPYNEIYGAVAVLEGNIFDGQQVAFTDTSAHPVPDKLMLITIKGNQMMELVNELYRRAADEA